MLLKTNVTPQASYTRVSRVLAEQTLDRQKDWLSDKPAWGGDKIELAARDAALHTFSFLKGSDEATSTEQALAEVALLTTDNSMAAKFSNAANEACLQAISGQIVGPAGLVVARAALQAQEKLEGIDADQQAKSLGRVLEGLSGMGALSEHSQELAKSGLQVNGNAAAQIEARLDILSEMVAFESAATGPALEFKELKTPQGIENTRFLSKYGVDMSKMALQGKLGPFFGREAESRRAGVILTRKTKNNAVFIGPAGVGKTAVAEKMALDAVNDASHPLNGKTIVQLDLAAMVAGTQYRGMFEERMKGVIDECTQREDIVLFIDELHTMMGAGSGQNSPMDASNILKPALARGDLQVIGSTTQDEYEEYIMKDPAMERRFAPITIDETSQPETTEILGVLQPGFENFHNVEIPQGLLTEVVKLAEKAMPERYFPDKAIDLLDEAMSSARLNGDHWLNILHVQEAVEFMQKGAESLTRYGRDVTELAEEGKLGPFTGRVEETRAVERSLQRAGKNNPVLVGDGGVGKTAIVEKLAVDIQDPEHPLHGKRLIELSMTDLLAGTGGRGEFEERMKTVLRAAKRDPNVILFIDEIHTLMGAGGNGSALDAANMLKPALARGELTLIGATTLDEYKNYIKKDPALERRFDPIFVDELNREEALEVMKAVSSKFENHHGVEMPDDLMPLMLDLADKSLPSRKMPDKAIDVLDLACSEAAMRGQEKVTADVIELVCKELREKEEALR